MPNRESETDVDVTLGTPDDTTLSITTTSVTEWTADELWSEPARSDSPADKRLVIVSDPPFGWSGYELRDGQIYDVGYNTDRDKYDREKPITRETFAEELQEEVADPYVGEGKGDFATHNSPP